MKILDRKNVIGMLSAMACLMMLTTAREGAVAQWLGALALMLAVSLRWSIPWAQLMGFWRRRAFRLAGLGVSVLIAHTCCYGSWLHYAPFVKLVGEMGIPIRWVCLAAAGGLLILSWPFLCGVVGWLWQAGRQEWKKLPCPQGSRMLGSGASFAVVFGVYLLGLLGILRANFHYIDDLGRAAEGYKEWGYYSRYVSVALSTLLHGGSYLTDISPLPQILAPGILAFAGVLLLAVVYERRRFFLWEVWALVILGLNPYFLECFSYQYDAPYMAISVLAGIFPLVFSRRKRLGYVLASLIGTLVMCTTYQAASGIYPVLVVVLALRMWNRGEPGGKVVRFCLDSAGGYLGGLALFKLLILRPAQTYSGNIAQPSRLLPTFLANLRSYYALTVSDCRSFWLVLAGVLAVGFLVRSIGSAHRSKAAALAAAGAAMGFMLLLGFGVYPAFTDAAFYPRTMYGLFLVVTLWALVAVEGESPLSVRLAAVALSWALFVFSFTYGNALQVQQEYTEFRMHLVLRDMNRLEQLQQDHPIPVEITGTIGQSPVLERMAEQYPVLNRLVPNQLNGDWMWGVYKLYNYYDLKNVQWNEGEYTPEDQLPILQEHLYETVRGNEERIQIHLK